MLRILSVLVLLLFSFVGGIYFERLEQSQVAGLNQQIEELEKQSAHLTKRNDDLRETLNLVKRQIQTDRIAYQALQETVENSESGQAALKQQLLDQRALLEDLRKKLEQAGG